MLNSLLHAALYIEKVNVKTVTVRNPLEHALQYELYWFKKSLQANGTLQY